MTINRVNNFKIELLTCHKFIILVVFDVVIVLKSFSIIIKKTSIYL